MRAHHDASSVTYLFPFPYLFLVSGLGRRATGLSAPPSGCPPLLVWTEGPREGARCAPGAATGIRVDDVLHCGEARCDRGPPEDGATRPQAGVHRLGVLERSACILGLHAWASGQAHVYFNFMKYGWNHNNTTTHVCRSMLLWAL